MNQRVRSLFATPTNFVISALCLLFLAWIVPPMVRWTVLDAVWSGTPEQCIQASGACWLYVREKFLFFVFGMYPESERWRAGTAIFLLVAAATLALMPRFWGIKSLAISTLFVVLAIWLLVGGMGLPPVPSDRISGLPATLVLALVALPLAFPVSVLLVFARLSRLWFFRITATLFIELLRCSPLVAILFMVSTMMPFFVPAEISPAKFVRAFCAFTLVAAAYMAEALRGGVQAIPEGQKEAAMSLGLRPWQAKLLIILPPAIKLSVPGLVNVVVVFFKETSLIVVIGMADFLGAIQLATRDPQWAGFNVEGYVFAACSYFLMCYPLSLYGNYLEKQQKTGH